ncbi:hypothetical protein DFH09DRAFT_1073383 [Mycena vulgaris]|nr:hypothetical protein DFH09DRAFT_1073383 [Mycena vulgaris]
MSSAALASICAVSPSIRNSNGLSRFTAGDTLDDCGFDVDRRQEAFTAAPTIPAFLEGRGHAARRRGRVVLPLAFDSSIVLRGLTVLVRGRRYPWSIAPEDESFAGISGMLSVLPQSIMSPPRGLLGEAVRRSACIRASARFGDAAAEVLVGALWAHKYTSGSVPRGQADGVNKPIKAVVKCAFSSLSSSTLRLTSTYVDPAQHVHLIALMVLLKAPCRAPDASTALPGRRRARDVPRRRPRGLSFRSPGPAGGRRRETSQHTVKFFLVSQAVSTTITLSYLATSRNSRAFYAPILFLVPPSLL